MSHSRLRSIVVACAIGPAALRAQTPDVPDAHVVHTMAALRLDGVLDEPAWLTADSVTDFTQKEPAEGRPATERTVVRLLATPDGLWVGV